MNEIKEYEHLAHKKFKMRFHIIFSTKYRKKLLNPISNDIKRYMNMAYTNTTDWKIEIMEIDPNKSDHIHFLIRTTPNIAIANIIHSLKQISTYYVWKEHYDYMRKWYWGTEHHLWTRGYFCTTIGDVSEKTLKKYIEEQG